MGIRSKQSLAVVRMVTLLVALTWASAPTALAQTADTAQLVRGVDPSIVVIRTGAKSLGSGFLIDDAGTVATNYHVIRGATEATVSFPADKDEKLYPVEGVLETLATKDLAIIRIKPGNKKLRPLKLASELPARGDAVFAFGAPMGLSGSVSNGIVSAVRSGKEVSGDLTKLLQEDLYKSMGYDLDATWIQVTTPISAGNSGGPLVNGKGEVVGLNTWTYMPSKGQNLNFAICSIHLKTLIAGAGANVKPLAGLSRWADREWRGRDGALVAIGQYVEGRGEVVLVRQADGKTVELRTAELSAHDRAYPLLRNISPTLAEEMDKTRSDITKRMRDLTAEADAVKATVASDAGRRFERFLLCETIILPKSRPENVRVVSRVLVMKVLGEKEFLAEQLRNELPEGFPRATVPEEYKRIVIRGIDTSKLVVGEEITYKPQSWAIGVEAGGQQVDGHGYYVFQCQPIPPIDKPVSQRTAATKAAEAAAALAGAEEREAAEAHARKVAAKEAKLVDKEGVAAGKLRLAKTIMASNPDAGKRRLQEIVDQHPQTAAGKEAKEMLGRLDK